MYDKAAITVDGRNEKMCLLVAFFMGYEKCNESSIFLLLTTPAVWQSETAN